MNDDELTTLRAENAKLRKQVELHCERIVGQSDLLTKAAMRSGELQEQAMLMGMQKAADMMAARAARYGLMDSKTPAADALEELASEVRRMIADRKGANEL